MSVSVTRLDHRILPDYEFGISTNLLLPPSTGASTWRPLDMQSMHNTYMCLANSINNLAANQLVRRPIEINNDIIATIQQRNVANRSSSDNELMSAFEEKLSDLRKEL